MATFKNDAMNQFWNDYASLTVKAWLAGTVVTALIRPSSLTQNPFAKSPIVALWMGIAGGVALS